MAKKHGRNKEWCKRYRATGRRESNLLRKLKRHLTNMEKKILHREARNEAGKTKAGKPHVIRRDLVAEKALGNG